MAEEPVLLIEGPSAGEVFVDGKPVVLVRKEDRLILDSKDGDTGISTWDGARKLALFLNDTKTLVRGKNVLELGAGTGVSGLAASLCGAAVVTLTDLEYSLPQLVANVNATLEGVDSCGSVRVRRLDWTDSETFPGGTSEDSEGSTFFDVILAADVAWLDHLVDPLVTAINACVHEGAVLFLAHQSRTREVDEHLFSSLGTFLSVDKVRVDGKISIYQCRRLGTGMDARAD